MGDLPSVLSREQIRSVDRRAIDEYGMLGLVLMENAGRGVADLLLSKSVTGPVAICCGKGNNGGDGFVIARHLDAAGVEVHVLLAYEPGDFSGDAAANLAILEASALPVRLFDASRADMRSRLREAEWIIDALLGTGLAGEVREPYRSMIEQINDVRARVLAVDLPSGLDCDRGVPLGPCIRADMTATFVARKSGFDVPGSEGWTGPVKVLPIGVPRRLLAAYNG